MIPLFMTKPDAFLFFLTRALPATSPLIRRCSDPFAGCTPGPGCPPGLPSDTFPEGILVLCCETISGLNNALAGRNLVDAFTLNSLYVTKTLCVDNVRLKSGKERRFNSTIELLFNFRPRGCQWSQVWHSLLAVPSQGPGSSQGHGMPQSYQWPGAWRWFSPGIPVFSTTYNWLKSQTVTIVEIQIQRTSNNVDFTQLLCARVSSCMAVPAFNIFGLHPVVIP